MAFSDVGNEAWKVAWRITNRPLASGQLGDWTHEPQRSATGLLAALRSGAGQCLTRHGHELRLATPAAAHHFDLGEISGANTEKAE